MKFTFQKTDGNIFYTDAAPKQITDYWRSHKQQLKWCLATEGEQPDYVLAYFWHEGHKSWNDLLTCDEKLKKCYRLLIKKYYMEAFDNGLDLEHVARLDD